MVHVKEPSATPSASALARASGPDGQSPPPVSRRDRQRAQTRDEIKRAAYAQIADGGLGALSLNAIARTMGLTGPALYRYYPGRDELITDLLAETYQEWGEVFRVATARVGGTPKRQLLAGARALRAWALEHPERYDLLYGRPLPGYAAPEDATRETARAALDGLTALLAAHRGVGPESLAAREAAVLTWARLHGFLSLELGGHFDDLGLDVDRLFERDLRSLLAG